MALGQTQLECMQEAAAVIRDKTMPQLEWLYGVDGVFPQEYHHPQHTQETVDSAIEICEPALADGKIEPFHIPLIVIGAVKHDYRYNAHNKEKNEEYSGDAAVKDMKEFDCFDEEHFAFVRRLINATRVTVFFPRLIQNVDPNEYAQCIIADADLHYFGREPAEFLPRALSYLEELKRTMGQKALPFLMNNVVLLQNHQWNTTEAGVLYPHINDNIAALKSHQTTLAVQ